MEGSCPTGQSPQQAAVPVEEEEEEYKNYTKYKRGLTHTVGCVCVTI
jgi:hypothetical protein